MKILRRPVVELIIKPTVDWQAYSNFLFENFTARLELDQESIAAAKAHPGDIIPMLCAKACYKAWGVGRKNIKEYLDNIKESGHGSVLEHANFGIVAITTRAITHEIVRHRAGFAFSQESQRFCDEKDNSFIMPLSIQGVTKAEELWTTDMERALNSYVQLTDILLGEYSTNPLFKDLSKTDLRKKCREASRGVLPNDTAAVIHITGNIRAWRHFLEMRSSRHAEAGIRMLADETYNRLVKECPIIFGDYQKIELPDGTFELESKFKKV